MTRAQAIRDGMMRGDRFSWSEVSSWIESGDIELAGAAFEALMSKEPVVDGDVDHACAERFGRQSRDARTPPKSSRCSRTLLGTSLPAFTSTGVVEGGHQTS